MTSGSRKPTSSRLRGSLLVLLAGMAAIFMLIRRPPVTVTAGPGDHMVLTGIVRDFRIEHPDFGVVPADGYGHCAGNVAYNLNTKGKPIFMGSSAMVTTQWRDSVGRPIAPHWYNRGAEPTWDYAGIAIAGRISLTQGARIDSWDSTLGTYDETQSDQAIVASLATGADDIQISQSAQIMGDLLVAGDPSFVVDGTSITGIVGDLSGDSSLPTIEEPADMGESVGDKFIFGSRTISHNIHCDRLFISDSSELIIDGDITILCEGRVGMGQATQIKLNPGASLMVYTKSAVRAVRQDTKINANTKDPSRVTFYHMSDEPFAISQSAEVYANIIAPYATVSVKQFSQFYGRVAANELDVDQTASVHMDIAGITMPDPPCGLEINDTPGTWGIASTGGINSRESFYEWFTDVPGVNISKRQTMTLRRAADGLLEYETEAFYPIDGRLYGNEGGSRNAYFTYEVAADFVYEQCGGQVVEVEADDDLWIFIGGRLAIDLGGMRAGTSQVIDLDRFDLDDGESYSFKLFYAQRQGLDATFRMRTNIALTADPVSVGAPSPFLAD